MIRYNVIINRYFPSLCNTSKCQNKTSQCYVMVQILNITYLCLFVRLHLWNVSMLIICFHFFQVQENFLDPYTYHNIKLLFIRVWLQYCIFFWKEKKSISTFLIHSVHFDIQSFSIHNHDKVFNYKWFKVMHVLMKLRLKPPSQVSCSNIHFSKTKCRG